MFLASVNTSTGNRRFHFASICVCELRASCVNGAWSCVYMKFAGTSAFCVNRGLKLHFRKKHEKERKLQNLAFLGICLQTHTVAHNSPNYPEMKRHSTSGSCRLHFNCCRKMFCVKIPQDTPARHPGADLAYRSSKDDPKSAWIWKHVFWEEFSCLGTGFKDTSKFCQFIIVLLWFLNWLFWILWFQHTASFLCGACFNGKTPTGGDFVKSWPLVPRVRPLLFEAPIHDPLLDPGPQHPISTTRVSHPPHPAFSGTCHFEFVLAVSRFSPGCH